MHIKENISLSPLTTMKVGGPARFFCEATSLAEIEEGIAFAKEKHLPLFVLGGGSNLLVGDDGYPGLVMRINMKDAVIKEEGDAVLITAGAGHSWDELVALAVVNDAWGIENLSAIPGTVGGAAVQNIGAYGSELKDAILNVEVYDPSTAHLTMLSSVECHFGYRDSIWKHEGKGLIILRVTFRLEKIAKPNILYKDLAAYFLDKGTTTPSLPEIRAAVVAIRAAKFPDLSKYGTAGSFFKNPIVSTHKAEEFLLRFPDSPHFPAGEGLVKLSAAWIIDRALHLRGVKLGQVGCWDAQALVLVNYGGAHAEEVMAFVQEIQKKSLDACGIALEPEVIQLA